MTLPPEPIQREALKQRAAALKLHGLLAHFDALTEPQLATAHQIIEWEITERRRRGLVLYPGLFHRSFLELFPGQR